ncbi:MAG TPA: hypothetical protein VIM09_08710, partial [Chthoniobacterales bacterium]
MISWTAANFWLIPLLPLAAALLILGFAKSHRAVAVGLAVIGQLAALSISIAAFTWTLQTPGARAVQNFTWFTFGDQAVR